ETQINATINDVSGVQVEAKDSYGNGTYNYPISMTLTPVPSPDPLTGGGARNPDTSGNLTFSLSINTAGIFKLRAATGSLTTDSGPYSFLVAQTVESCGSLCNPSGSFPNNSTVTVQALFSG